MVSRGTAEPPRFRGDSGRRFGPWSLVYQRAQCSKCHRFAEAGDAQAFGPELTTVARWFDTREILESVLYPSHTISDQYASQAVMVDGRMHIGIVTPDGDSGVILQDQDGNRRHFDKKTSRRSCPARSPQCRRVCSIR